MDRKRLSRNLNRLLGRLVKPPVFRSWAAIGDGDSLTFTGYPVGVYEVGGDLNPG